MGLDHQGTLADRMCISSGQQHPDILNCRARDKIIEVEEEPALVSPQQVSGVAVSVNPMYRDARTAFGVEARHLFHGLAIPAPALGWGKSQRLELVEMQEPGLLGIEL
ncbi:MAG: hypothetical protein P8N76_06440 [Pirellulaceae bacterium]|nr:hypothetical protein [Pirellulaceae bacterium]